MSIVLKIRKTKCYHIENKSITNTERYLLIFKKSIIIITAQLLFN